MNKLPINVKFHCENGMIAKIDLAASKGETKWQVISDKKNPALEKMINIWMEDYCHCRPSKVHLPMDLENLPAYTRKILMALMDIPMGETLSYKELAVKTKNPRAARAVGNACGRNPFPLVIPCHRVLKSDGSLGGYGLGTPLKEVLLKFEDAL